VIGTLVGISMLFSGISRLILSLATSHKEVELQARSIEDARSIS